MKKRFPHLTFYDIPHGTPEWLEFRERGVGGSEISAPLNMNPFKSSMRLYAEKTGYVEPLVIENEAVYHGSHQESYVKDRIWIWHDGSKTGYIENAYANKQQRKYSEINSYAVNPKYPWLFASLDGLIDEGQMRLEWDGEGYSFQGTILEQPGILEVKTIRSQYAKTWDDGLPVYYILQVIMYLIVYELEYAEIIVMIDGREASIHIVEYDEELASQILSISKKFWYDHVVPGKELVIKRDDAQKKGDIQTANKYQQEFDQLMPEPDDSMDCNQFLKEAYQKDLESMIGEEVEYEYGRKIHLLNRVEAVVKKEKLLINNRIIDTFVKNRVEKLDFDPNGYIKFTTKANASKPSLYNGVSKKGITDDVVRDLLSNTNILE